MSALLVVERTVKVGSSHGLHARPAKLFASAAANSGRGVTLAKAGGNPVNAASILAVLSLRIAHGDAITVAVTGDNAASILDELVAIVETNHDE